MIEIKLPFSHVHSSGRAEAHEWHVVRDVDYNAILAKGWPVEAREVERTVPTPTEAKRKEVTERGRVPVVTKSTPPSSAPTDTHEPTDKE